MFMSGDKALALRLKAAENLMPIGAVSYLKENQIGPNLALDFDWNGFVIWNLYPKYKLAADGRNTTVYKDNWIDDYLRHYKAATLLDFLGDYRVDALLVKTGDEMDQVLSKDSLWMECYRDWQAAIYLPSSRNAIQISKGPSKRPNKTIFFPGDN